MELEAQSKDQEKQKEEDITEETKSFTTQEMARGFSLFKEALLVFEVQDLNVEWDVKVATAVHNAIRCYCVISDDKKRALTQTSLDPFFKKVGRIEPSKEPEPVSLTSGLSETAACPPSPIVLIPQFYHLPPAFFPLVSNAS